MDGELITDYQAYEYGLLNGFLPKHTNKVLRDLCQNKLIKNELKLINGDIHKIKSMPTRLIL